jgi:hypothetical protein
MLCQSCHSQAGHPSIPADGDGLASGPTPSQYMLGQNCMNCHTQSHGYNHLSPGAGVLALPSDWVTAGTTEGFTALNSSLAPVNIETDRQILEIGSKYLPTRKVKLYADYSRQQRDGVNVMAGARFTQSAFLPRPVDDYTDQVNAGMRFAVGPVNPGLAYFGSFYRNKNNSLTWDNPYTADPGGEQGRLALEPDNDFQQFSLSGVYRTARLNTVVAFSTAFGRGEQNTHFGPYASTTSCTAIVSLRKRQFLHHCQKSRSQSA